MSGGIVDGYLRRIGVEQRPEATYETLVDLHHRHLDTLPYDNLSIMLAAIGALDEPHSVDPILTLERVAAGGNAGYCFHHNGLVALVLEELGFDVVRRPGQLIETTGPSGELDHLAFEVRGLPTAENPGGRWWPDLGFGDAFREPLPLVDGHFRQNGFVYRLVRVGEDGWTFHHDPAGSFHGNMIRGAVGPDEVAARHPALSTPPGPYTSKLVVQRRDATGADTVRSIRHTRIGEGATTRELRDFSQWCAALTGIGLSLADVDEDALRRLHERQAADYDEWLLTR